MTQTITIIKGDGIGPEIMDATIRVMDALDLDFNYEFKDAGLCALEAHGDLMPAATLDNISKNKICLKGPLTTPVGKGFSSINVALRRHFNLYANVRPVVTFEGTKARYDDIDILTIRENPEGAYLSEGQTINEDNTVAESKIIVTREASERIVRYAFELAVKAGRKKVTAVHKANIMKTTSGLFLDVAEEVAKDYPSIEFNSLIVDNTCMQLVMNPAQFDMIVTTNLFGDIISDAASALPGSLGLMPSASFNSDGFGLYEPAGGSAPELTGKNKANPMAQLLSLALMLEHSFERIEAAEKIRQAINAVLNSGFRTSDIFCHSSQLCTTSGFTNQVIEQL